VLGYKNHLGIDRRHGFIRRFAVTNMRHLVWFETQAPPAWGLGARASPARPPPPTDSATTTRASATHRDLLSRAPAKPVSRGVQLGPLETPPADEGGDGRSGAQGRNRTTDTRIFSPLLYRLSYLGIRRRTAI
jgi:hypothetical protein